jgi:inhibitor of KinA
MLDGDQPAELTWASERHLRLCFRGADSERIHSRVRQSVAALQQERVPGLIDLTPAYSTILLEFDLEHFDEERAVAAVRQALAHAVETPALSSTPVIEIPVCYEVPCAPDAEDVARIHGIDVSTLIHLHTQPLYIVQFIGFAPGFGYLGGLPSQLATPRLATPRVRVPAGSVGIAEQQTGIYPTSTAGGWRLIGRTPLVMFDAGREKPSLLAAGDRVRFVPIDLATFNSQWRGLPSHE